MRIGIDLGGTKTELAVLADDGCLVLRTRRATPTGYRPKLETIRDMVLETERSLGLVKSPVGVGHPGSLNPRTGLMRNANSSALNGQRLREDLMECLDRPVACANDANCFALSEALDGAGRYAASVFGVIIGTGVGGGIVIDKALVAGADSNAGEWGHIALPWPNRDEVPGPACKCGLSGCLEAWCSGPGLSAAHERATGAHLTAEAIAAAAFKGDRTAQDSLDQHASRLARGLASVVNILDPELIVLGGGLSNLKDLAARLQARLGDYVFTDEVRTQIVLNVHGDSSGVRGAAWLNGGAER